MTYSILALDSEKKLLVVGVASGSEAAGSRVPWIKRLVGAVATQGYTNIIYGVEGLRLLERGYTPKEALARLLERDSSPELRQVAMIDIKGRKAVHVGTECPEWKGYYIGGDFIVIGNLLRSKDVLEAVVKTLKEEREENLVETVLKALLAGEEAGGDARGDLSAALLASGYGVDINLRIDRAANPVKELAKKYHIVYRRAVEH